MKRRSRETALLGVFEGKGRRINAIAQACWLGAVRKNVAEMTAAAGAGYLDPTHAKAAIFMFRDGLRVSRNGKAGPAAARVELGIALKQQLSAASTVVVAGFVILGEGAGKSPLGALFAQHVVLLRGKLRTPLGVGFHDFLGRIVDGLVRGSSHAY